MDNTHDSTCGKKALRTWALAQREGLGADSRKAADQAIAQLVAQSSIFANAPLVFTYCSFGSEVDTCALIEAALCQGKVVALPRCVPGTRLMAWHRIASLADTSPGFGGIPEPADNPATLVDPQAAGGCSLALVPGLLFDDDGYRLGYGGGYYDRFLAAFPGISLGLTRTAQRVPDLRALGAVELFDQAVDWVADETGLRRVACTPTIL